jgi:hypothetical protein
VVLLSHLSPFADDDTSCQLVELVGVSAGVRSFDRMSVGAIVIFGPNRPQMATKSNKNSCRACSSDLSSIWYEKAAGVDLGVRRPHLTGLR